MGRKMRGADGENVYIKVPVEPVFSEGKSLIAILQRQDKNASHGVAMVGVVTCISDLRLTGTKTLGNPAARVDFRTA